MAKVESKKHIEDNYEFDGDWNMERLAILDHANHKLYIVDVSEETLQQYGGEEEKYIEDNYEFDGDYSWDYITDAEYMPSDNDGDFIEINFDSLTQ